MFVPGKLYVLRSCPGFDFKHYIPIIKTVDLMGNITFFKPDKSSEEPLFAADSDMTLLFLKEKFLEVYVGEISNYSATEIPLYYFLYGKTQIILADALLLNNFTIRDFLVSE